MAEVFSTSIKVNPSVAFRAFDEWSQLMRVRGQSLERILRRLMKHWIALAISQMKGKGLGGDVAKIEADLSKIISLGRQRNLKRKRARSKAAAKYRGTVAAWLVAILNWGNARTARGKSGRSLFYG